MNRSTYYAYILKCADGTLYTGITTDLKRRVTEHNTTIRGAKYTRVRRPVSLVYNKRYRTRSAACVAEAAIKKLSKAAKLELIAKV